MDSSGWIQFAFHPYSSTNYSQQLVLYYLNFGLVVIPSHSLVTEEDRTWYYQDSLAHSHGFLWPPLLTASTVLLPAYLLVLFLLLSQML